MLGSSFTAAVCSGLHFISFADALYCKSSLNRDEMLQEKLQLVNNTMKHLLACPVDQM